MASCCGRSRNSLKGWNEVDSRVNAIQFGCDDRQMSRRRYAALWVVALFLSLTLMSGCFRDPNVRKHKYLESGQKYSAQGKDREAAIQFSNALKIDKNFAEAHYALSQAYLHLGAFSAAYGELQKTVNLQPANVKARSHLGKMPLAIQFSNALKIDKNFAEAHYALSQAYLHLGAFSAAYGELQKTVNLQPANVKARIDLGNMLLAGNKIDDAQAQAAAALASQPSNADVHALLARIAARQGQKDIALTEIHRALELAPNEAALHETLALLEVGDSAQGDAVEDEMKKSVALDPKSVNAKLLLAAFYSRNNRLQDAEHECWSAVATDPKNLSARESLVQMILRQGDQARAEQVLRQASNDLADEQQGVRMLADYYTGTGQMDKARTEFANLAKKYPKNVSVQEGYVRILLQVKDFATAQTVITELMKKNGRSEEHTSELQSL